MASLCYRAVLKPSFLKATIFHKFSKPLLYRFCSSALNEQNPDPKSNLSQTQMINNEKSTNPDEHNPDTEKEKNANMIRNLCKFHRVDDAKKMLFDTSRKGFKYDESLFLNVMRSFPRHRWDFVKNCVSIFLKMEELGVPITVETYNCLLELLILKKKYDLAEKYSIKMLSECLVTPNKYSCTLALKLYCGAKKIGFALIFLRYMKKCTIGLDLYDYNTVINGCVQVGFMEQAEEVLIWMKEKKVEPDLVTYNSMINGYVKVKKMDEAEKIMVEMKAVKIEPVLCTYNAMIHGYIMVGKMEAAHRVFEEMKGESIEPDMLTYVTMIKGYVLVSKLDYGLELFEEMKGKFFGDGVKYKSCLDRLKEDCDVENMSESQRNVLQAVEDHLETVELLDMRDAARRLTDTAVELEKLKREADKQN